MIHARYCLVQSLFLHIRKNLYFFIFLDLEYSYILSHRIIHTLTFDHIIEIVHRMSTEQCQLYSEKSRSLTSSLIQCFLLDDTKSQYELKQKACQQVSHKNRVLSIYYQIKLIFTYNTFVYAELALLI